MLPRGRLSLSTIRRSEVPVGLRRASLISLFCSPLSKGEIEGVLLSPRVPPPMFIGGQVQPGESERSGTCRPDGARRLHHITLALTCQALLGCRFAATPVPYRSSSAPVPSATGATAKEGSFDSPPTLSWLPQVDSTWAGAAGKKSREDAPPRTILPLHHPAIGSPRRPPTCFAHIPLLLPLVQGGDRGGSLVPASAASDVHWWASAARRERAIRDVSPRRGSTTASHHPGTHVPGFTRLPLRGYSRPIPIVARPGTASNRGYREGGFVRLTANPLLATPG
ncbi:hypothetical protein Pan216_13430 [Planctomycetes bacterium Pan216]|uniref:Uncharacterized protein n=1 Tax=Kolteria novifilia TaxID=2527975 RepID=A0A518B0N8_9BACT|nr:hypothetical protein Pan216_13430 [Planctomycetes bacterium Pan216]